MIFAWIGAIAGGIIGVTGGIIGTYYSIKNTGSPRERAFMIRISILFWIVMIVFSGLLLFLPSPYRYFIWLPYSVVLFLFIRLGNKKQQKIREQEQEK